MKEVQALTTAAMIAAGSPGQLWSDAMETSLANEARSVIVRDGKTAYEL